MVAPDVAQDRLRAVSEIAGALAAATEDVDLLLQTVASRLTEVVGDGCWVRLLAPDNLEFEISAWASHPDQAVATQLHDLIRDRPQRLTEGLSGRAVMTARTEIVSEFGEADLASLPAEYRPSVAQLGLKSLMAVPLLAPGRVFGVIMLYRLRPNLPYGHDDQQLAEDIALHATLALRNAQLLREHKREIVERERLADRLRVVSGLAREFAALTADPGALQQLIARRIGEVVGDLCVLRMLTPDGAEFERRGACYHPDPATLALCTEILTTNSLRVGEGLSGRVAETGMPLRMSISPAQLAAMSNPGYADFMTKVRITNLVAVPIKIDARVVGVLSVARSEDHPAFTEADVASVEDLAAHASLAITNSRLIEAARTELAERMRSEAILRRAFLEAAPDAVVIGRRAPDHPGQLAGGAAVWIRPRRARRHVDPAATARWRPAARLLGVRKDGTTFAAEVSRSPIETPDGMLVATVVRDATELRRERNRRTQEANRLKSEFLANMSHELRTPLNSIIGFTSLIHAGKAGPVSAVHKEYLGDILTSSRHLLQLINDILDLSKVEAGRLEQRVETIELERVASEVRDIIRGLLADKRIHLHVDIDPAIGKVDLDPRLLKQVLYNYLSNAIKFTAEGGRVSLTMRAVDANEFRIDVTDNGIGIKPDDISRLFTEFQQVQTSRQHGGTGLGLALTKRLVEAQRGRVEVRSEWGVGSTFSAVLPRHRKQLQQEET